MKDLTIEISKEDQLKIFRTLVTEQDKFDLARVLALVMPQSGQLHAASRRLAIKFGIDDLINNHQYYQ